MMRGAGPGPAPRISKRLSPLTSAAAQSMPCPAAASSCRCPSASSPSSYRSGLASASAAQEVAAPLAWPASAPPPVAAGTRRRSVWTLQRGRPKTSASWSPLHREGRNEYSAPACREALVDRRCCRRSELPRSGACQRQIMHAQSERVKKLRRCKRCTNAGADSLAQAVVDDQRRLIADTDHQRNGAAWPHVGHGLEEIL